ncbi:uncharacterized protein PG986_012891 [Apiospora aurea]|uniref:Zn(2)-C6 fungal-type domain-containing protein n=1 Tax=Apiospora aurea TaxID=335848 RepID=A0ABR1Q1A4_9PEZI
MDKLRDETPSRPLLRKSRTGCTTCRQRRVKCDEVRPVCGNCTRRFVNHSPCEYGQSVSRRPSREKGHSETAALKGTPKQVVTEDTRLSRCPTLRPSSIDAGSRWRMLELRLMHHYTTVVCHTDARLQRPAGPLHVAADHPSIRLHLRGRPEPHAFRRRAALKCHAAGGDGQLSLAITRYLDRSLVYHRQAVKHIDTDIAEPIWLSAVVLSTLYWLISHHARPNETYELPLEAWDMVGGVSRLYAHRLELLTKLGYGWFGYDIVPSTLPDEDLGPERRAALQALDADMNMLLESFDIVQAEGQKIYVDAKAYVLLYYRAYFSGSEAKTLRRYIGTMALMLGPGYLERIRAMIRLPWRFMRGCWF